MNVSARPIALHVGLQYVCKVHGLTPHTSTGRCPFELIREGPTASLFPHLTKSTQRAAELTAVRQSVSGSGKRVVFTEGETVVVYDFKNKLSSLGVIKQVLGSNTYSVDCGRGPQHISGDALSKSALDFEEEEGQSRLTAQGSSQLGQEDNHDNILVQEDSDVLIESDTSDEEDFVHDFSVGPAVAPRRRRVRQLDLGPVRPTRLRPRNRL